MTRVAAALAALVLVLSAVGCAVRDDPSVPPSTGAGTAAATAVPASPSPSGPSSASTPTLIAFAQVTDTGTGGAVEVSGPDQIDRLVGGPPEAVEAARTAVARQVGPGRRGFAFVLSGCRNTGATVAIDGGRIVATLTGGEGVACFAAEWFLAVFAVPADLVPPGVRAG